MADSGDDDRDPFILMNAVLKGHNVSGGATHLTNAHDGRETAEEAATATWECDDCGVEGDLYIPQVEAAHDEGHPVLCPDCADE